MTDHDASPDSDALREACFETSKFSQGNALNGRASVATSRADVIDPAWLSAVSDAALAPQSFELARLWHEVAAGRWRFRDTFSTNERHFVVVESASEANHCRMHARNLEILRRVLLGQVPKAVAAEMRVGTSTATTAMQEALRSMGLRCRLAGAPVIVSMAVRAAFEPQLAPMLGRLTRIAADSDKYWLIGVRRLDLEFPVDLSRAEAMVIRELLCGKTHAQISAQRHTSCRTVANQLATASRKLGVSGRAGVLQCLITHGLKLN